MRKLIAVLLLGTAAVACSDSNGPDNTVTVEVGDETFSPSVLTIDAGTTVTFTWVGDGSQTHDVVFSGGDPASPRQSSGSWSHTFDTAGSYSYTCTVHGGPDGEITVQ